MIGREQMRKWRWWKPYVLTVSLVILVAATAAFAQAKDDGSNTKLRLSLNFNEAMNRCLQANCADIEEVLGFFADDATYLDEGGKTWSGKAAIRKRLTEASVAPGTSDRIEGIDVAETMITMRLERRRVVKSDKYNVAEVKPHLQVIVLKNGRITRLISVIPPEEK